MNMLCHMWFSLDRGQLSGSKEKLARLCNATVEEFDLFYSDAQTSGFCQVSQNSDGILTIINRRMYRNERTKESHRLRQQKYYHKKKADTDSTKSSRSLSPSPTPTPKKKRVSEDTLLSSAKPEDVSLKNENPISQCPHEKIIQLYHQVLPELPTVKIWNNGQKKLLRSRWKEAVERQTLTWWEEYFAYVRESDFLMGKKNEFCADMEWIVRPSNMAKIINGRYHRNRGSSSQKHSGITEWLRIREEKRHDSQG